MTAKEFNRRVYSDHAIQAGLILYQDIAHDLRGMFDSGQALIQALERKDQAIVIDSQLVQDRGVQVSDVHWVFVDVVAEVVGLAV